MLSLSLPPFYFKKVLSNGTLVISNLRATDQQLYTCEASSAIGRGTATVSLLVTGEYVVDTLNFNLCPSPSPFPTAPH